MDPELRKEDGTRYPILPTSIMIVFALSLGAMYTIGGLTAVCAFLTGGFFAGNVADCSMAKYRMRMDTLEEILDTFKRALGPGGFQKLVRYSGADLEKIDPKEEGDEVVVHDGEREREQREGEGPDKS